MPEPVLTETLMPKFEQVSGSSNPQKRIEGMKHLLTSLPESNRALLTWIFIHMGHVIERERFNKMTLQNVSIVLSPTMRISHRVLNCFFENSHILFEAGHFKKYVPPITSSSLPLPETEVEIEAEIRKQESLLADLHLQISSGAASKKTEEQIWEQQRIVTQLKRKLRTAIKKESEGDKKYEPIEYEEDLDFSLRVPSRNDDSISQASHEAMVVEEKKPVEASVSGSILSVSGNIPAVSGSISSVSGSITAVSGSIPSVSGSIPTVVPVVTSASDQVDHRVTVTIQKNEEVSNQPQSTVVEAVPRESHVTVIKVQEEINQAAVPPVQPQVSTSAVMPKSVEPKKAGIPLLPPPPASGKTRVPHSAILKPTPASPPPTVTMVSTKAKAVNNVTLQVIDNASVAKSKSLPRGLPSDESLYSQFQTGSQTGNGKEVPVQPLPVKEDSPNLENDANIEVLQMECLRLKLEFDELMAVKSELEQRKRSEYKEMEDLREEIATMQTLYQYR